MTFIKKMIGDARIKISGIEDSSVHLVVTSPPYNAGKPYRDFEDDLPIPDYRELLREVFEKIFPKLVSGGRLAINMPAYIDRLSRECELSVLEFMNSLMRRIGYKFYDQIVWVKELKNDTAWGSWLSASSPHVRSYFEYILLYYKDTWKRQDSGISTLKKDEFIRDTKNVWFIESRYEKAHPATFPLELPRRLINLLSFKGDTVLDPFAGTGTTGVAAKMLGRNAILIELSREYFETNANLQRRVF